MKPLLPLLVTLLSTAAIVNAQTKIKDGTVSGSSALPGSAAILELESNNKGLLLPRVSLTNTTTWLPLSGTQINGMTVYNTSPSITSTNTAYPIIPGGIGSYYWDGTGWVGMAAPAGIPNIYTVNGSLAGNRTVTTGSNFLQFANAGPTGGATSFYNGAGASLTMSTISATGRSNVQLNAGATVLNMFIDGGSAAQFNSNSATSLNIGTLNAAPINFVTGNAQRVTIDPAGNVGIGTAIPSSTLQVQGSIAANIVEVSGTYAALPTDHTIVFNTTTAGTTLTLPDPTTCKGRIYVLVNFADAVTIGIDPSAPIYAFTGMPIPYVPTDNGASSGGISTGNRMTVQSTGARWIIISFG